MVSAAPEPAAAATAPSPAPATQIVAGERHTCGITADKNVTCWGDASLLGDSQARSNTLDPVTRESSAGRPGIVPGITQVAALAAGARHTCAIAPNTGVPAVWCWGQNSSGQVGVATSTALVTKPTLVPGTNNAKAIAAGTSHSCVVMPVSTYPGVVKCWGSNTFGQLGNRPSTLPGAPSSTPVTVAGITTAVAVSVGDEHSCALLADKTVRCWGRNTSGQLGNALRTNSVTAVTVFGVKTATALRSGRNHTCVLLADTTAKCWGANGSGQLGLGTTQDAPSPTLLSSGGIATTGIRAIALGGDTSCMLLDDSGYTSDPKPVVPWCWGANESTQTGQPPLLLTPTNVLQPTATGFEAINSQYSKITYSEITVGVGHACAVVGWSSAVQCWGNNATGQLGNGKTLSTAAPVVVSNPGGNASEYFRSVSAGGDATYVTTGGYTCAVTTGGLVYCWGARIGVPPTPSPFGADADVLTPTRVPGINDALSVVAGATSACALLANGRVMCWGANGSGQLGNGSLTASATPVQVAGNDTFTQLALGREHACAITSSGVVKCWGNGYSQQAVVGTSAVYPYTTPVDAGITGARAIAAGDSHTCALLQDSSVRCWGKNDKLQLGVAGAAGSASPPVGPAITVTARGNTSCAVKPSGALTCWGTGPITTAKFGTIIITNEVASTTELGQWNPRFSEGPAHQCELVQGDPRCFGSNVSGEAGYRWRRDVTEPSAVSPFTSVNKVDAGLNHTCAADYKFVACWGANNQGQLGDGSTVSSRVPTRVALPSNQNWNTTSVTVGYDHSCVLSADGSVWCWGTNDRGQVGTTSPAFSATPVQVPGISGATSLALGKYHSCAIVGAAAELWCWGTYRNWDSNPGTAVRGPAPVRSNEAGTPVVQGVRQVAAGDRHTCALRATDVVCFGANDRGQLGGPVSATSASFATLPITNSARIVAGDRHTCVLRNQSGAVHTNGSLYETLCWGANDYGQLGRGSVTAAEPTPGAVLASPGVTLTGSSDNAPGSFGFAFDLRAKGDRTCTVARTNYVQAPYGDVCWGNNGSGQFGTPPSLTQPTPIAVNGMPALGFAHACSGDGNVICQGLNWFGQLGDGGVTNSTTPVAVTALQDVRQVQAGVNHTCAISNNGAKVSCWGTNERGQLGVGTNGGSREVPTEVVFPPRADGQPRSFTSVAVGSVATCATDQSELYCWGDIYRGVGNLPTVTTPTKISAPVSVATVVSVGSAAFCFTDSSTGVWCFGWDFFGETGGPSVSTVGTTTFTLPRFVGAPTLVAGTTPPTGGYIAGLRGGPTHACALIDKNARTATTPNRTARCWGANAAGQFGIGRTSTWEPPTDVPVPSSTSGLDVGDSVTCFMSSGSRSCAGGNSLGNSTGLFPAGSVRFTTVAKAPSGGSAPTLAFGPRHGCDGAGCWGANDRGQAPSAFGAPLSGLSAGVDYSCGLKVDSSGFSSVMCWGRNSYGATGKGDDDLFAGGTIRIPA